MVAEQLFKLMNLRELPVNYEFNESLMTVPCRIVHTNKIGQYFGNMYFEGAKWAIVLISGKERPEFIETKNIEILKLKWEKLI